MQEKVVNTRLTQELYEKLSKKAKAHRTTVSNLIRTLVEDTIEISTDISDIVDAKIKEKLSIDDKTIGYQEITLSTTQKCELCQNDIAKGTKAYLPMTDKGVKSQILICKDCMEK